MDQKEFINICALFGYPQRGWQTAMANKAKELGLEITQSAISIAINHGRLGNKVSQMARRLAEAAASGKISTDPKRIIDAASSLILPEGFIEEETDEEITEDIRARFSVFDECVEEVLCGTNTGLIVSGPPGCGKSYSVNTRRDRVKGEFKPTSGTITAFNLYMLLYAIKDGGVAVFDDCDDVFKDQASLNILKKALDTQSKGVPKIISWLSESNILKQEDIPKQFEFDGRILFFTNKDFDREIAKNNIMSDHYQALIDRTGYLYLNLGTRRRQFLRAKQICDDFDLFEENKVSHSQGKEILEFVREHIDDWRLVSARLIVKICEHYVSLPKRWKERALTLYVKKGK